MPSLKSTRREIKPYKTFFLHNTFQNLIHGLGNWFTTDFYTDFKSNIVSTYTKAIQQWSQDNYRDANQMNDGSRFVINTPSILINPVSGNYQLYGPEGNSMWRYQDFSNQVAVENMYRPFFSNDDLELYQITQGITFPMDVIINCESAYQYKDMELNMIQWCHGFGRPFWKDIPILTYTILPEELSNYIYENYYNNVTHQIDWSNNDLDVPVSSRLIETINQEKLIVEFYMYPQLKLESISNANEIYGGANLDKWVLNCSFEVYAEMNTHMVIYTDQKLDKINYNLKFGKLNSKFTDLISVNNDTGSYITFPNFIYENPNPDVELDNRYYHIFSEDTPAGTLITLPYAIDEDLIQHIIVNSNYGQLIYGKSADNVVNSGFWIDPNGTRDYMEIGMDFLKDDTLEIYIFKKVI